MIFSGEKRLNDSLNLDSLKEPPAKKKKNFKNNKNQGKKFQR